MAIRADGWHFSRAHFALQGLSTITSRHARFHFSDTSDAENSVAGIDSVVNPGP